MEPSDTSNLQEPVESQIAVAERSLKSTQVSLRQQKRRRWLIAGVVLAGAGVAVWRLFLSGNPQIGQQPPPGVLVKVQKVQSGPLKQGSRFLGTLEAKQGVVLRPESEGRVTQIFVSSGATVKKGQPILQLSPDKTQADFGAAVANVNVATAASSNAQAQLRAVEAERKRVVAELDLQNTEFSRTEKLVKQGALAKQVLDQVRRDRAAAQASLRAIDEQIRAAQASLSQSRASLAQAKANALSAREDLQETRITAPIAGIVGDIPIKLGSYVTTADTLTTIIQNKNLELNLNIPIEEREQLALGLPVELSPAQSQTILTTGRISFVSPTVNNESQSVLAKASFPNPQGKLRDGQRVEAKVIWQTRPGILVPTTAISRIGGKPFIFVADQPQQQGKVPPMVARQQPVELGSIQGNDYQVLKGIKTGETIVVSGLQNLKNGDSLLVDTGKPQTPSQ
ncbi:efflux RND transporter periplasmic adaptor subunit [Acaryochloris sp. IP29b_bin.148]|uniref:efflux RND transporter periplasmic adaptor subunit n=1 Tax=Acaryochloris sp. IP29b_bin.148 TaxID=2969218 RepID=UPI002636F1CA|nr:efflux RND transporter periplasmic adaptor subunit [Acaryochloris sp. IP29b_bin.148]